MAKPRIKYYLCLLIVISSCVLNTKKKNTTISKSDKQGEVLKEFTLDDILRINEDLISSENNNTSWQHISESPSSGGMIALSSQGRFITCDIIGFGEQEELGLKGVSDIISIKEIDKDGSTRDVKKKYVPYLNFNTREIDSLFVSPKEWGKYTYVFPKYLDDQDNMRSIDISSEEWASLIPENILVKDFIYGNYDKDNEIEVAVAFSLAGKPFLDKLSVNVLVGVFIFGNPNGQHWEIEHVFTNFGYYTEKSRNSFSDGYGLMETYDGLQKIDIYHDGVEEIVLSTLQIGGKAGMPLFYVIRNSE